MHRFNEGMAGARLFSECGSDGRRQRAGLIAPTSRRGDYFSCLEALPVAGKPCVVGSALWRASA